MTLILAFKIFTESSSSSGSMQIGFWIFGKVEVDDYIDGFNVNSSCAEIGWNETTSNSFSEIMKHFISANLIHFCMDIIARNI